MLPNPSMSFSPFAILTAEELNDIVENIESLSDGSGIEDDSIVERVLALGVSVQTVYAPFATVATSTSAIPLDDTEPQISEGFEIMTASITPKSSTNILVVEASGMLAMSGTNFVTMAIFRDATANALSATTMQIDAANTTHPAYLMAAQAAGSTSSTTFRVRAGRAVASDTITFNGRAGSRLFGNIPKSYIKITEYKA